MAGSRFQEEMNEWDDHPGSVEALLHVDAQLHDDPLGYTRWEASGSLARLLSAATSDEASWDEEAEARAVAGFNVAMALDDDNFYGRDRRPTKQRRAMSHAAFAGVLAAGVLAATSGLAAAAHTSVAKVVSDIADGLSSSPPAQDKAPTPTTAPSPTPTTSTVGTSAAATTAPGTTTSCSSGANVSGANAMSANVVCGTGAHKQSGEVGATRNGPLGNGTKGAGGAHQSNGSGKAGTGATMHLGSGSSVGGVRGEGMGSHRYSNSGSGSGGSSGSQSGGGPSGGTGNGGDPGANPQGHFHRHPHHHHSHQHVVDLGGASFGGS
jgi:hypothetical protein